MLTIGIPTYNRPVKLKRLLLRLISIPGFSKIQLIISDNSDNNKTKQLVGKFVVDYMNIQYYKNNVNLGFDRNMVNIYNMTNTKYLWFLSDDDDVSFKSYDCILSILENDSPDLICLNTYSNGRLSYVSDEIFFLSKEENLFRYLIVGERINLIGDEIYRAISLMMIGFMSSCLVRKNIFQIIDKTVISNLGGIPQIYLANMNLQAGSYCFYVTDFPVVKMGYKPNFSSWFMESCYYGVKRNFNLSGMNFSDYIIDLYVYEVLSFTLNIVDDYYNYRSFTPISKSFLEDEEWQKVLNIHLNNRFILLLKKKIELIQSSKLSFKWYKSLLRLGYYKHKMLLVKSLL